MNFLEVCFTKIILNIKSIAKNKILIFSFIFFGIMGQIISIIFIPFHLSAAVKMAIAQSGPFLLLLGGLSYSWKKSTLNKNENLSSSNKLTTYFSLIITLFLIGNIVALFNFGLDISFGLIGIELRKWIWEPSEKFIIYLNNINWLTFFYSINLNILVTFSLYFVIYRLTSSIKNYFIVVLCILILSIIFGGSLNNYFIDFNKLNESNFIYGKYGGNLFPDSFFPISLIFPFFSTGEFYQLSIFFSLIDQNNNYGFIELFNLSISKDQWQWTLVLIFPYINILIYFIIGILFSYFKKDKII